MKTMKLLFLFAALWVSAQASETVLPKPRALGWPTADYATLSTLGVKAEMAVFDFGNGKKAFIKDPAWLTAFQTQLASTTGKPGAYCFCIAYPIVRLVCGEKELVAIELTHSNKIRFLAGESSGDFIIPAVDYDTLVKLERAAIPSAIEFPKTPAENHRRQPARVELKP